jgi:hypothetical protein
MAGTYELWLTTDTGLRIAALDYTLGFTALRVVDGCGWFGLALPSTFDVSLIQPDRMVQVWRAPQGGRLSLWRPYFIRKWRFETRRSEQSLTISGPDVNDLLRRRTVVGYAGSYNAQKTLWADNMMKELVSDATGINADAWDPTPDAGTRIWPNLSVAADLGLGPVLTLSFAWGQLLTSSGLGVLPQIAKASREAGTEVFFDIVPDVVSSTGITFQFRTYTEQPGQDVSDRVVFDQEHGSLEDPFLERDYSEEINYVYSGGQGEEADRNIQQVYDAARYGASAWGRCEAFADARNQEEDNGVIAAGQSLLESGRPVRRGGGTLLDTQGTRFGRDWDIGYKVRARYRGEEFDAIIRAVSLGMDGEGRETVQARLEYEGD